MSLITVSRDECLNFKNCTSVWHPSISEFSMNEIKEEPDSDGEACAVSKVGEYLFIDIKQEHCPPRVTPSEPISSSDIKDEDEEESWDGPAIKDELKVEITTEEHEIHLHSVEQMSSQEGSSLSYVRQGCVGENGSPVLEMSPDGRLYNSSVTTKSKVPVESCVQYGPKEGQLLDVFGGQLLPRDAPILVYVHGGYWQDLSRNISAYCVMPQYQSGIRVIIVGYDLAPKVMLNEIKEEIKAAGDHIINMAANLGARSVWFCGHSAGAHLVAMLLFSGWLDRLDDGMRSLVKGFVLISGVYDLTPLVNTYVNDALRLSCEEARALSPMLIDVTFPAVRKLRILVAVGEHDSPEFQRQSHEFTEKLRQHSQQVELITLPCVDHFDIVENLQEEDFILTKRISGLVTSEDRKGSHNTNQACQQSTSENNVECSCSS